MPGSRCQVSGASCQVKSARCNVEGARCEVQVQGVRCKVREPELQRPPPSVDVRAKSWITPKKRSLSVCRRLGTGWLTVSFVVEMEMATKKPVRPECFVSHAVEKLIEWIYARQSDMRVVVEVGNARNQQVGSVVSRGVAQLKSWILNASMASKTVT